MRWLVAIAALGAACRFDPDHSGSRYRCDDAGPCPSGFRCERDQCVPEGAAADAAREGDATDATGPGVDAGVCELAAEAPNNDTCAEVGDNDVTDAARGDGGVIVHGDTTGHASSFQPPLDCTGTTTAGPDAVYRLEPAAGETVTVTLTPEGWDGAVYLLDGCTGYQCLAGADTIEPETLQHAFANGGVFYIVVDAAVSGREGCYSLHVILE